jgi:NADPH:quinone reductase-like Zn-dependent oxidoreductase
VRAVFIERYGGPEALVYGERPRPVPGRGQVLIEVHAASVNPRDWLLREGRYVFRRLAGGFPLIPGSDVSGMVAETGPGVRRLAVGDEVFGMQTPLGRMGGYAELVAIAESALARKPAEVTHEEAAAFPCAGLTAYQALTRIGRVGAGAKVAVLGASGGVGTYAVQIARALGAEVTAVTSHRNAELVRSLGAGTVVDYTRERFAGLVRGQDVVLDAIGRDSLASCAPALAPGGRYITTIPNLKNAGTALRSGAVRLLRAGRGQSAHVVLVRADGRDLETIGGLLASGAVRSVIDTVFPLSETRAAHEKSRTWRTCGKLVLRVR